MATRVDDMHRLFDDIVHSTRTRADAEVQRRAKGRAEFEERVRMEATRVEQGRDDAHARAEEFEAFAEVARADAQARAEYFQACVEQGKADKGARVEYFQACVEQGKADKRARADELMHLRAFTAALIEADAAERVAVAAAWHRPERTPRIMSRV